MPQLEQSFLSDQRDSRKMFIGSIDVKNTGEINKNEKRKQYLHSLTQPRPSNSTEVELVSDDTDSSIEINTDDINEYQPPQTSMNWICLQLKEDIPRPPESDNRERVITKFKNLPYLTETCDRVEVSDRGAALLSTSLLDDIGVVQQNSSDNIIDR